MNGRQLNDDVLRRAFETLAESAAGECTEEDLARIRLAIDGELPPAERRALVERLATDPALAEAWRVAHELRPGLPAAIGAARQRAPWWSASWLAAAAVLLLAVTVVLVSRRDPSGNDNTMRDPGRYAIESLVTSDAALSRDALLLRWSPGPQDARYQVRVTTEDLRVLSTAADLSQPELLVDGALLADVTPGSRVFWQVEVVLPNGERVTSPTFVVTVR